MEQLIERDFYLPSEIGELLRQKKKSKTTFYGWVKRGKIRKVIRDNKDVYNKMDVDFFLSGGNGRRSERQEVSQAATLGVTDQQTAQSLAADLANRSDLLYLYVLESEQFDFARAIVPPVLESWHQINDHIYWMLFDPSDRQKVIGMLGILPLPEQVIQKLLRKEISPSQILASDVLVYKAGEHYSCFIISAVAESSFEGEILRLVERVFAFWCEQSIIIDEIYTLVKESEDSSLLRIVTHGFFSPLKEEQWLLRPLNRGYQPAPFVKNYRDCILQKKENDPMLVIDHPQTAQTELTDLEHLRQLFSLKRDRNLLEIFSPMYEISADGHITRKDGAKQHDAWVRPIKSANDILAAVRINASHFGASKKFTEDELVATRLAWLEKNQDIYRVLELDGEVVGFIFALPLPLPIINRLLVGEIKVGDLTAKDILQYKPGVPVDVYLQTLGVHKRLQGHEKLMASIYLIAGMQRLITSSGERGIEIRTIFTTSHKSDGIKLSAALGFDEHQDLVAPDAEDLILQLDFTREKTALQAYWQAFDAYHEHVVQHSK